MKNLHHIISREKKHDLTVCWFREYINTYVTYDVSPVIHGESEINMMEYRI